MKLRIRRIKSIVVRQCDFGQFRRIDAPSLGFLYRPAYPDRDQNQPVDKMQPDCLKLDSIIRKCKFGIPATAANNAIRKEGKNAPNMSFIHVEVGDFERLAQEAIPHGHKPNWWMWKRVSGQSAAKSLEWIHWGGGDLKYGRIQPKKWGNV